MHSNHLQWVSHHFLLSLGNANRGKDPSDTVERMSLYIHVNLAILEMLQIAVNEMKDIRKC